MAGHSNDGHPVTRLQLAPRIGTSKHVSVRLIVAPISPSPRSVPRSFSTETSLLVPSHDAPRMLGPWRVAHSSNHSPTRPHDPTPRPQDTLESYHAISAGSSKMPLRGDKERLYRIWTTVSVRNEFYCGKCTHISFGRNVILFSIQHCLTHNVYQISTIQSIIPHQTKNMEFVELPRLYLNLKRLYLMF